MLSSGTALTSSQLLPCRIANCCWLTITQLSSQTARYARPAPSSCSHLHASRLCTCSGATFALCLLVCAVASSSHQSTRQHSANRAASLGGHALIESVTFAVAELLSMASSQQPFAAATIQEPWSASAWDGLRLFSLHLTAIGGSGAAARTVLAPLERIKVLQLK